MRFEILTGNEGLNVLIEGHYVKMVTEDIGEIFDYIRDSINFGTENTRSSYPHKAGRR